LYNLVSPIIEIIVQFNRQKFL